jgi:predicted membrane protein
MTIQRTLFTATVAVVFIFAGYNLWNYFSNQQEIQAQKELEAERQATERERRKSAEAEARRQGLGDTTRGKGHVRSGL